LPKYIIIISLSLMRSLTLLGHARGLNCTFFSW
jgi:hypothetical protein